MYVDIKQFWINFYWKMASFDSDVVESVSVKKNVVTILQKYIKQKLVFLDGFYKIQ